MVRLGMAVASPGRARRRRSPPKDGPSARQLGATLARASRPPGAEANVFYFNLELPNLVNHLHNLSAAHQDTADQRSPTLVIIYIKVNVLRLWMMATSPARGNGQGRAGARRAKTRSRNETFNRRADRSHSVPVPLALAVPLPKGELTGWKRCHRHGPSSLSSSLANTAWDKRIGPTQPHRLPITNIQRAGINFIMNITTITLSVNFFTMNVGFTMNISGDGMIPIGITDITGTSIPKRRRDIASMSNDSWSAKVNNKFNPRRGTHERFHTSRASRALATAPSSLPRWGELSFRGKLMMSTMWMNGADGCSWRHVSLRGGKALESQRASGGDPPSCNSGRARRLTARRTQ